MLVCPKQLDIVYSSSEGLKSKMANNFGQNIVHDTKSTNLLYIILPWNNQNKQFLTHTYVFVTD